MPTIRNGARNTRGTIPMLPIAVNVALQIIPDDEPYNLYSASLQQRLGHLRFQNPSTLT